MFGRWSRFVVRFRWQVLAAVLVAVLSSALWGLGVFDRLGQGGYLDPGSDAAKVQTLIEENFGRQDADAVVLYTAPEGKTADDIGAAVTARLATVDRSVLDKDIQTYWNVPAPVNQQL